MSKYQKNETLPLEYGIYNTIAPSVSPILYEQFGITPNMITSLTVILSIYIVYLFINKEFVKAGVLVLLRQVLDGLDGYIARKYNLQSKFGKKYDAYTDYIFTTILFALLIKTYWEKSPVIMLLVSIPMVLIMYMSERKHNCIKKKSKVCQNEEQRHEILKFTRAISPMEIKVYTCIIIGALQYL